MRASEIHGRADHYRIIFGYIWGKLREPLLKANSDEEVTQVLRQYGEPYAANFVPHLVPLILKVIHEPDFPKWSETQANFLADSLAALGLVTPRTSRDICERERSKEKHATHIISYEFKIKCSCGYKGFSRDHACPKCKAEVPFPTWSVLGPRLF